MTKLKIVVGDITKLKVDAIVNAANKSLLGGGGVDGAIHRAAGPELLEECRALGGCEAGEAKITKGYNLPAKFVIHTVGPVYSDGKNDEERLLTNCYINSLRLAKEKGIKTIAFPSISTGAYGFPKEKSAKIVSQTLNKFIKGDKWFDEIILVFHSEEDRNIYSHSIVAGGLEVMS